MGEQGIGRRQLLAGMGAGTLGAVAALGFVELGIGQARRAWLTKDQVLNTRSWAEIR